VRAWPAAPTPSSSPSKVGCDGADVLACLRGKSADELVAALPFRRGMLLQPGVWWGPVVDGVELPRLPLAMIRAGDFARVPLIIGTMQDEGALHTVSYDQVTPDELRWFVRDSFDDDAAAAVPGHYAGLTPKATLTRVVSDGVFVCNARRTARAVSSFGVPVYLYQFTHALDAPRAHPLGATHSVDLFFVFGNVSLDIGVSPRERPLSNAVMDAWGAFARGGDPSTPAIGWPRYDAASDRHLTLDLKSAPGVALDREQCDFWDRFDRAR
jgi:para-nitrobenzyl esterase